MNKLLSSHFLTCRPTTDYNISTLGFLVADISSLMMGQIFSSRLTSGVGDTIILASSMGNFHFFQIIKEN